MNNDEWQRVQTALSEALRLSPDRQRDYLEATLADSTPLLQEAMAMLDANDNQASILDEPASIFDTNAGHFDGEEWLGGLDRNDFQPYRILRPLGRGGMGMVLLAERPDEKSVAIKLLRRTNMSPEGRRRFVDEIQTLGSLEHPNIARLYHADTLKNGMPWFAMEYVRGAHLDDYCRPATRSLGEIVGLFRQICEAVQQAHIVGLIHRDLKPSNILVKSDGSVKLLDFGIARQVDQPDWRTTAPGDTLLTLPYAAPEQILGSRVGTYTDTWALGVNFYEMLAGGPAFAQPGMEWSTVRDAILQTSPVPVSVRAKAAGRLTEVRKSEWRDLDAVCVRAMDKDPKRRYQSAGDLLREIDHFVKGEPLEAKPEKLGYVVGKFVKRNRAVVVASTATLILLLVLTVFLALSRKTAVTEAERARRMQHFLINMLQGGDDRNGPSQDLKVVTLLDNAVREARALNTNPEEQADMYTTLGTIFRALHQADKADSLLQSSLARRQTMRNSDTPQEAETLVTLGLVRSDQARYKDGENLIRQALAIATRVLPRDDPDQAKYRVALGSVLYEEGRVDEALSSLFEALRMQSGKPERVADLSETLNLITTAYISSGQYEKAEPFAKRAVQAGLESGTEKGPDLASDLVNLGQIQYFRRQYAEAEQTYRQALAVDRSWYGDSNPETADVKRILGQDLLEEGRLSEAKQLAVESLKGMEQAYGPRHPRIAYALMLLGRTELKGGSLAKAIEHLSRAVEILRIKPEGDHLGTGLYNLGRAYLEQGEYGQAEKSFIEAGRAYGNPPSVGSFGIARVQLGLGNALLLQNRYGEAEDPLLTAWRVFSKERLAGAEPGKCCSALVTLYTATKQPEKTAHFREVCKGLGLQP